MYLICSRYLFKSGTFNSTKHILVNATVEVQSDDEVSKLDINLIKTNNSFYQINYARCNSGILYGDIPKELGRIKKFQLRFLTSYQYRLLINEINFLW